MRRSAPRSAAAGSRGRRKSTRWPCTMRRTVRAAARARLARAAVDPRLRLERAGHAVRIAKVAQRRAAELERARQRRAHRRRQALGARPAEAVAARARIDAGREQRLAGVDVAGADDDVAAEQRRLDRRRAGRCSAACRCAPVEAPDRRARRRGRPAAWRPAPASSAGDQTTAPKRRGSVRRSVPRVGDQVEVVVRPGGPAALARRRASPTCPGAAAGRRVRLGAAAATGTCRAASTAPDRLPDQRLAARSRAASAAACPAAPRSPGARGCARQSSGA